MKKQLRCALAAVIVLTMAIGYMPSAAVFAASGGSGVSSVALSSDFKPTPAHIFQDGSANAGARLDDLLSRMTLDEKISRAKGSGAITRLNLNSARGGSGEALHGVAWDGQATVFPNSLGLSQTWDNELMWAIGDVIAKESLANGVSNAGRLAPVVDLLRDPRYGRAYETLGEDAVLTGGLATAMAHGMNQRTAEGYQQFIPILKHFYAYSAEINRLWIPSSLTPRSTNEYAIKAFKYPVSAGASKSLMNSYPVVNGKPMSVNRQQHNLLFEWTPDYDGTGHYEYQTMNDYGSGSSVFVHSQRALGDNANGLALGMAQGIKNGQMAWSFRSYGGWTTTGLEYEALARGMATEKDYEEVARRSLAMQLRMGDMDQLGIKNPYLINPVERYGANRAAQLPLNRELALRASQEQIVLLKNDGDTLPLSGEDTAKAILLGSQGDQILKDFYSGSYKYRITIKDALENKLGSENVFFDRAVDTVAIKSVSNGKYLTGGSDPAYFASGSYSSTSGGYPATTVVSENIVTAAGETKPTAVNDAENLASVFEVYDYGSANWLLRTPINGRYVQVVGLGGSPTAQVSAARKMYNNTSAPGEGNLDETATGQNLTFSNYQKFRLIDTDDGHKAIYHHLSGSGVNGGTPLAYDVDDEDINRGSYLYVNDAGEIVPDIVNTNGPWQTEYTVESPVDNIADDNQVDNLPDNSFKFDFENIQSVEEAAAAQITAAADPNAPVILVVGTEPHLNAREAVDLYKTGLSAQQMRLIDYVTAAEPAGLNRDVILVVKTGNPMTIDKTVAENPKVKSILLFGQTGQEEGSALVSALFDDGYSVPDTGWAPADTGQFTMNTGVGPNGPNEPFEEYPGYLPDDRVIPAHAPAGRLSATWYDGVGQMIGASEEHPPASYVYPAYDESTNDNLSNMNGTIPTGLLTYDIIKGERTYMYLNDTPLYPFGYGLTYTSFEYSDLVASEVNDKGIFTVSGTVTNTGDIVSDEVIQIYSAYDDTPTRIKQPNSKLIAYTRLQDIAPGESADFSLEVDLLDKLGVWDVETGEYIVEPGNYKIIAGHSSAEAGESIELAVDAAATPERELSKITLAENFDDYSNLSRTVQDIETVAASIEYEANQAILFRQAKAWLSYKDVVFGEAPAALTVKAGSDRVGKLSVYALPTGSDVDDLAAASPVAEIELDNTRIGVDATNLGIGPVGQPATATAPGVVVFPGSDEGQAEKDHYVKPELNIMTAVVSGLAVDTAYDLYLVSEARGSVVEWLKFGAETDATEEIEVYSIYSADSIRETEGELRLSARLTPESSAEPVVWSLADTDAALASIDQNGVVKAKGGENGTVTVTAVSGSKSDTYEVMITNQLPKNKVEIGDQLRTVDYMILNTTGTMSFWGMTFQTAFAVGDSISSYQGTLTDMVVKFRGIPSEVGYTLQDEYLILPPDAADYTISDLNGNPTDLATIELTENEATKEQFILITATGKGDGKVLVTATLKNNPDIVATRAVTLTNQGEKDPFKMIQVKDYNPAESKGLTAAVATYAAGGNEIGYATPVTAGEDVYAEYKKVDFADAADQFYIRTASGASAAVDIWIDGKDAATGGTKIGSLNLPATGNANTFNTYGTALTERVSGLHDVYLVFSGGAVNANWFQFVKADPLNGDSTLKSLTVSSGSLSPAFSADKKEYRVSVANSVTSITVIATANSAKSTVSGDGTKSLAVNDNTVTVTVTAEDGSKTVYTIVITRAAAPSNPANPVGPSTGQSVSVSGRGSGTAKTPETTTPTVPTTPVAPTAPVAPTTPVAPRTRFDDTGNHWAEADIDYVAVNGLFNGTANRIFSPDLQMTRGMIVTVLANYAVADVSGFTAAPFSDTAPGAWYTPYVAWAAQNGVVSGFTDGTYRPDQPVTREQMAVILRNFALGFDLNFDEVVESGAVFTDQDQISLWASDAVDYIKNLGAISGRPDGSFDPQATATRAEVASMLRRYVSKIIK